MSKSKKRNFSFLTSKYNLSDDDLFLLNRVADWAENGRQKYIKKFTGFLDEGRQFLCKSVLESLNYDSSDDFCFFGGYKEAQRKILCVSSKSIEISDKDFPLTCLNFRYRKCDELSHRDFLGSLMALGITRDSVGDILISTDNNGQSEQQGNFRQAQVFLTEIAADEAEKSLKKIGRVGVKVSKNTEEIILSVPKFSEISGTVSSLRLDCVLSLVAKISREKANEIIKSGKVMVNHFECENPSNLLKENDEFSVRGKGKFILKKEGNVTKKGKIHINVLKYL